MKRARVRSLYDSDAVLRQAAGVLRTLGWSETSRRFALRTPGQRTAAAHPHEGALARRAAVAAALRRGREVLDTLARALDMRARSKRRKAG